MDKGLVFSPESEAAVSPDASIIFTLDVFGAVKFLSPAGERVTGYKLEELRRMRVMDLISTAGTSEINEQVRRSIGSRVGNVFEVEIVTKDGRLLQLEISLHAARCVDGTIEIQGIAVARQRARCLDERFIFRSSAGRASREFVSKFAADE